MARLLKTLALTLISVTLYANGLVGWLNRGPVPVPLVTGGVPASYTPVVLTPSGVQVFANTNGKQDGDFWVASGSWGKLGPFSKAFAASNIKDFKQPFIRTTAVAAGASTCYAIWHVGGTTYQPAFATARRVGGACGSWTYHGRVSIQGLSAIDGNGENLIISEGAGAALDATNPLNNRFLMYEDTVCFDGQTNFDNVTGCPHIAILMSADGTTWVPYRDSLGVVVDFCPDPALCSHSWWPAAARTFSGVHVLAVPNWPNAYMFHLYSCDGIHATVLEASSDVADAQSEKGTNLVWEPGALLLHALSNGVHWTSSEQAYPCN